MVYAFMQLVTQTLLNGVMPSGENASVSVFLWPAVLHSCLPEGWSEGCFLSTVQRLSKLLGKRQSDEEEVIEGTDQLWFNSKCKSTSKDTLHSAQGGPSGTVQQSTCKAQAGNSLSMFLSFCRMASKGKQSLEGCPSTPCR
jgi:hypothetical protein